MPVDLVLFWSRGMTEREGLDGIEAEKIKRRTNGMNSDESLSTYNPSIPAGTSVPVRGNEDYPNG